MSDLEIINISQVVYSLFTFCESLVFLAYDRTKMFLIHLFQVLTL